MQTQERYRSQLEMQKQNLAKQHAQITASSDSQAIENQYLKSKLIKNNNNKAVNKNDVTLKDRFNQNFGGYQSNGPNKTSNSQYLSAVNPGLKELNNPYSKLQVGNDAQRVSQNMSALSSKVPKQQNIFNERGQSYTPLDNREVLQEKPPLYQFNMAERKNSINMADIKKSVEEKQSLNQMSPDKNKDLEEDFNLSKQHQINSAEIEREIAGLPQAKSSMMATYEKSEILFRPPNVYRQTLNVDNLIAVCSKKLKEDQNHRKALFIRASSYLKKGMFQPSIHDCNNLMQLDNQNAGAYYVRGCAYEKLEMIDASIQDFTTVLQIDPNHINAAYARGACENKRGNFAKAIEDYNMALAIDKERTMSPTLNRRQAFRGTQSNLSNVLDYTHIRRNSNGSKGDNPSYFQSGHQFDLNSNSMSQTHKGLDSQSPLNNEQFTGKGQNNASLMSPSINQSYRAGFMNDTRLSMQSSILKTGNPSLCGTSIIQGSRNVNNQFTTLNQGNKVSSINTSLDFKGQGFTSQDNSLNNTGALNQQPSPISQVQRNNQTAQSQGSFTPADTNKFKNLTGSISVNQQSAGENQKEVKEQKERKQQAEQYHAKGYDSRKKGDYQTAIKYYSEALQIMPNHFKALFNRGFAYDKIQQFEKAIDDYSRAIQIDPNNAYTYYNKGISLDRKGDYDEAIICFSKAISIEPNKADFYHNRGFAYRKKREFDNAIRDYQNAIQRDPKHFKAYYNRAFCWDKLNKYEQSEEDYSSAVNLQPQNVSALHHLGTIREKIGGDKLELALENFNQVIQIDSSYAPSYNGRGLVWDRFFKFDEAIKDFTKAIQIDINNPVYLHNRGCCYRNMGDLDKSIRDFDEAIKLDDKNPIIYSNRGLVNRKLERFELAITDYQNEIKYGPVDAITGKSTNIKAFNNRAYCLAKLGRYKEAIIDYTNVIEQDRKNVHALHNRGISYERQAKYKEAVKDFTSVIQIDPNNANAYFNRGCCYDSIGELDLAISDYSVALELDLKSGNEDNQQQHNFQTKSQTQISKENDSFMKQPRLNRNAMEINFLPVNDQKTQSQEIGQDPNKVDVKDKISRQEQNTLSRPPFQMQNTKSMSQQKISTQNSVQEQRTNGVNAYLQKKYNSKFSL